MINNQKGILDFHILITLILVLGFAVFALKKVQQADIYVSKNETASLEDSENALIRDPFYEESLSPDIPISDVKIDTSTGDTVVSDYFGLGFTLPGKWIDKTPEGYDFGEIVYLGSPDHDEEVEPLRIKLLSGATVWVSREKIVSGEILGSTNPNQDTISDYIEWLEMGGNYATSEPKVSEVAGLEALDYTCGHHDESRCLHVFIDEQHVFEIHIKDLAGPKTNLVESILGSFNYSGT